MSIPKIEEVLTRDSVQAVLDAATSAVDAANSAADSAISAIAGFRDFTSLQNLLNDTSLSYGTDQGQVQAGDIVRLKSEGESYEVVAQEDIDSSTFKTAGGVRLRRSEKLCSCAGCLPVSHALRTDASASNPVPIDQIDGVLYGAWSNELFKSLDNGDTWSSVSVIASGSGDIRRILATADGEVIVLRSGAVLKSVAWPAPTSWDVKVTAPAGAQYIEWSLDGNGTKFIAADYAVPHNDCRYVSISLDAGDTWSVVIDRADTGFFPIQDNQTHWHGVAYDYIQDRFWVCVGDLTYKGHYYSDDNGLNWSLVSLGPDILGNFQATTISTTPHGMLLGSDDGTNNGLGRILRTDNPLDQKIEIIWRWPHRETSIRGFALKNAYDPITGITYTSWRSDRAYAKPILTWSDGLSGGLLYEFEGSFSEDDTIRNVVALPDGSVKAWIDRAAHSDQVITIPKVSRGSVTPSIDDTGGVRGGRQTGGRAGVAVGPDAVATQFSVAIGANADADRTGAMAIGWNAFGGINGTSVGMTSITADEAVAIGRDSNAGARGVAVGRGAVAAADTVAIGRNTAANGSSSVVIGVGLTSSLGSIVQIGAQTEAAASGVAVGFQAKTEAIGGVAIGLGANTKADNSVAIGLNSVTHGARSIAIGRNAASGTGSSNTDNVVIGDGASSPTNNNVVIGQGATVASGNDSTLLGRNASAGGQWAVCIGSGANTTIANAMAIGVGARGAHDQAIAIGHSVVTELSSSLAIGTRDLQIFGNGTKGIVLRSPDGTRYRATIANGGTWSITSF